MNMRDMGPVADGQDAAMRIPLEGGLAATDELDIPEVKRRATASREPVNPAGVGDGIGQLEDTGRSRKPYGLGKCGHRVDRPSVDHRQSRSADRALQGDIAMQSVDTPIIHQSALDRQRVEIGFDQAIVDDRIGSGVEGQTR